MRFRNVYTCFDLDRCDRRRGDVGWVAERLADAETRLVAVWRGQCLTTAEGAPTAYYCDAIRLLARYEPESFTLLGVSEESAYFSIDLSDEENPLECLGAGGEAAFEDLRRIGPVLPPRDGALYAYARAMAHDVAYHSSQPWPFPASLMIGFTARATGRELEVDRSELEHALWMTRDEVRARIEQGTIELSPNDSISRRLVDEWLRGEL